MSQSLPRQLNIKALLQKKSFFLFGPRSTGKSTLILQQLQDDAFMIDLLNHEYFLRLSNRPQDLEAMVAQTSKNIIVIDEIQKIPALLDEVHRLIEKTKRTFLLTGSSARRIKKDQANLLAGRAWDAKLFPLIWKEIPNFDLLRRLSYGSLPQVWTSAEPFEELQAYVLRYLKEEIAMEGWVRNLPPFSRFLEVAASTSGDMINFTSVANDVELPPSTVREYFSILEDTLLGFVIPTWKGSTKRKAISRAKFYMFDTGVTNILAKRSVPIDRQSGWFGKCFESFLLQEVMAYHSYNRTFDPVMYWRAKHGQEVDMVIGDHTVIEVKASQKTSPRDAKGLRAIMEEKTWKNVFLVSQDPIDRKEEGIEYLHWERFLDKLWSGKT